jgi:CRISPR-associated protein Cas2
MLIVIAYDVNTETKEGQRRLRRVARACEDYGQRVQKSVFECVLRERDWVILKARLLAECDPSKDSLRFYFLDEETRRRTEHHGARPPVDFEGPLIV